MAPSLKSRSQGLLDQSPSHQLHRALQLSLDIFAEAVGPDGLTQRQYAVLTVVSAHPGLTQSDLVKATGIDRSTLADLVGRMTTKGLLERKRSNLDARAVAVHLTQAGKAALEATAPKVVEVDRRILSMLPKGRRNGFMDILIGLAAAADAAPEQAKAEARSAKKAAKEARKAERLAAPRKQKSKKNQAMIGQTALGQQPLEAA